MPFCSVCNLSLDNRHWIGHLRSNNHKNNSNNVVHSSNGIDKIKSAFRNRLETYRISAVTEKDQSSLQAFFDSLRIRVKLLLDQAIKNHKCVKVNFELFALFLLFKNDAQEIKSFGVKNSLLFSNYDFDTFFDDIVNRLLKKSCEFQERDSGWTLLSISHLEININKYQPLRGSKFIELPRNIICKKACINIENNDDFCFFWSIVAALYPTRRNSNRVSSYPDFRNVLKIDGVSFPVTFKDISIFENINPNIRIIVYGLENEKTITGPLYKSKFKKMGRKTIHLLLLEKDGSSHYCLIRNVSRLVRNQITKNTCKLHFCEDCLLFFKTTNDLDSHGCGKVATQLPESGTVIQFKNYERKQYVPYVFYADFETMLVTVQGCEANPDISSTRNNQIHVPIAFAFYLVCSHDKAQNKLVSYRGIDCVDKFVSLLFSECNHISDELFKIVPMKFTAENARQFESASHCHICKNLLFQDRVRDHDHITGIYRGAAHNICNLRYKSPKFIPIFFHNLSGYDCHLFIKKLGEAPGPMRVIAKNKENYISFTKFINCSNKKHVQLRFVDSFKFLSSSLDKLARTLKPEEFTHLRNYFSNENHCKLLSRKGVYPYDYMTDLKRYDETQLPSKKCFYNSLTNQNITDEDYAYANLVWRELNIHNLGEYTDLYLKTDVLLLSDIFENFRSTCKRHYQLDPCHYLTAPSLSFDAMLLITNIRIELIDDLVIYKMIQAGIRGGICMCSYRYARSNNKYNENYDPTADSVFIAYIDANNLYGYAMCQYLPLSGFRFLDKSEIEKLDICQVPDNAHYGYILEVDLVYPVHLHSSHNDLPFCAEQCVPPGGCTKKLITNLYPKYNYVIHYVHLKTCLKHGLILKKVHRVITFVQKPYLKKYIELNTYLRQTAQSEFEQDFFKLLNNSIFGKTLENSENRVTVHLINQWADCTNRTKTRLSASQLIARPNFHSVTIFSDNFVAIQMTPEKIVLDKPIYIGFSVLELSKNHMYDFHYSVMQPFYKNKIRLCYTDTDSFIYRIETSDYYDDVKNYFSAYFDTSNYTIGNRFNLPLLNKKVPGLFKDEMAGSIIQEFVGLRPKLYCIKSTNDLIKKAKGVNKCVVRDVTKTDYKHTLFSGEILRRKNILFKSIKHEVFTRGVNKIVLSSDDDKRVVLSDQISTLAWGNKILLSGD